MKVVVLGGGESGYGAAVLAKVKGEDIFVSDFGAIGERYRAVLDKYDIEYEQGGHTMERILSADLVIKSPGIPETAPVMKAVREQGIAVISEIEYAGRYTQGRTICITGSNGKTTTTTLTGKILQAAGYDVAVGGNIGESFAYEVATRDRDWYVLELSSFQLDGMYDFRADIAVLMNITPDHLDRYDYNFQNYVDSKMRIVRNQRTEDYFIYCADDKTIASEVAKRKLGQYILPFGSRGVLHTPNMKESFNIDPAKMRIKGLHNYYNAQAAGLAALAAGVPRDVILSEIYNFKGVEHRLERVEEIDGVEWINDSKATNVDSTWYALESMRRPTIWIAGGTDKGNDYAPLAEFARTKVKALVCMGVDNAKLIEYFTGIVPVIYDTHSIEECVARCREIAESGDCVLLSPACASFDLFKNYEDRGEQFKRLVVN